MRLAAGSIWGLNPLSGMEALSLILLKVWKYLHMGRVGQFGGESNPSLFSDLAGVRFGLEPALSTKQIDLIPYRVASECALEFRGRHVKNGTSRILAAGSNGNHSVAPINVAIIGGGFSGAVLAVQLLRADSSASVAIIEKSSRMARGIAYNTPYERHLLNIPAGNMSALCDEPNHFLQWVRTHHDATAGKGSFLSRAIYGQYLESLQNEAAELSGGRRFQSFQDEAVALYHDGSSFTIQMKSGKALLAETVVLALGNLAPRDPDFPGLVNGAKKFVSFAWSPAALEDLPNEGSVLLIGSGLTSVDMAAALDARGFRGTIHVLSRHGLMPQRHKEACQWAQFWNEDSPRTARGLLSLIRGQVRDADAAGMDWRGVIDALRPATQAIWRSLPNDERRRFLRHARAYWEIHRHRIAPEIDGVISRLRGEGRLLVHPGRITNYSEDERGAEVAFRCRRSGGQRRLLVDRVINCTGSEFDCRRTEDPLLANLQATGMAKPGPLSLGLDIDSAGAVLDRNGLPTPSLYAIGPLRKGTLWETTAVPEIRKQASELAQHLLRKLNPTLQLARS